MGKSIKYTSLCFRKALISLTNKFYQIPYLINDFQIGGSETNAGVSNVFLKIFNLKCTSSASV